MKFKQSYSIIEDGHGEQLVNIIITDNYIELLADGGSIVNCIELQSVKQDIKVEAFASSVDELQFGVKETACDDVGLSCLNFILEASNVNNSRFIAVYLGAVIGNNLLFVGKINSKISGNDICYKSDIYEINEPFREYKFTALGFDIALLERCKFNEKIFKEDGTLINNLNERITDYVWDDFFKHWLTIYDGSYYYTEKMASLYKVIQTYLYFSSMILRDLYGGSILFTLKDSNLGIKAGSAAYEFAENIFSVNKIYQHTTMPELELKSSFESPLISYSLINPDEKNKELSFVACNNVAELLSKIAASLGCFITITTTDGVNYDVEFVPYKSVVDDTIVYIKGYKSGEINLSSALVNKANEVVGMVNTNASDGVDYIEVEGGYVKEKSNKLISKSEGIKSKYKGKEVDLTKPILTTATTLIKYKTMDDLGYYIELSLPINIVNRDVYNEEWDDSKYSRVAISLNGRDVLYHYSNFYNNAIYRYSSAPPCGAFNVVRPIIGILANIDGQDKCFEALSDYVNFLTKRDKFYYETEVKLSVPFWNGFSTNSDGSDGSWKSVKLGRKVKIGKTYKKYIDGEWQDVYIEKDYIIVGIERNMLQPETKVTLHKIDRFTINEYNSSLPSSEYNFETNIDVKQNYNEYEAGENITAGCAVSLINNKVYKTKVNDINDNSAMVGIATNTCTTGQNCKVLINGLYYYPNGFTGSSNSVIVRNSGDNGLNLTNNLSGFPNANEFHYKQIGELVSMNRVLIKKMEARID